jgi:hypothetical protein
MPVLPTTSQSTTIALQTDQRSQPNVAALTEFFLKLKITHERAQSYASMCFQNQVDATQLTGVTNNNTLGSWLDEFMTVKDKTILVNWAQQFQPATGSTTPGTSSNTNNNNNNGTTQGVTSQPISFGNSTSSALSSSTHTPIEPKVLQKEDIVMV